MFYTEIIIVVSLLTVLIIIYQIIRVYRKKLKAALIYKYRNIHNTSLQLQENLYEQSILNNSVHEYESFLKTVIEAHRKNLPKANTLIKNSGLIIGYRKANRILNEHKSFLKNITQELSSKGLNL